MLSRLLLVQRRGRVEVGHFLPRCVMVVSVMVMSVEVVSVKMVVVVVMSRVTLLNGCPHTELGQPVH